MASSIVTALNRLNQSKLFFEDFLRETKGGMGEMKAKAYLAKINWILMDFKTICSFGDDVRASVKAEIESDSLQVDAIYENLMLLTPDKRQLIETIIEGMLKGEEIKIVEQTENY